MKLKRDLFTEIYYLLRLRSYVVVFVPIQDPRRKKSGAKWLLFVQEMPGESVLSSAWKQAYSR